MGKRYATPTWVTPSALSNYKCDVGVGCDGDLLALVCDVTNDDEQGFTRLYRAREVRCRVHRTATYGGSPDCHHGQACKVQGFDEPGNRKSHWECNCVRGCGRDDQVGDAGSD